MSAYVKNAWYMVGWEAEVPQDGFLTRTILDKPMLFYRRQDGGFVGMVDRCPHRFAPLSMGKREGDAVVCGYHGLAFDESGTCIRNPFSDLIPPGCTVETFVMHAKDTILWMWPGDPARADPGAIADFSCMAPDAPMPQSPGHLVFDANYELLTDNLMDLSHIEFVHTGTFGGGGVIFRGEHSVREEGDTLWSNWWMADTRPGWATFLPPEMKTDHWLHMRWTAPASMMLEIGLCPAGVDPTQAPMPPMRGPHIITPETQTRSHYFYGFSAMQGEDGVGRAFREEDQPMLEAVQRSMGDTDFWSRKPVILNVDAGAVRARRRLMKLRREEGSQEAIAAE
ncbi:Rieske 2Fe-2S domain-containing protein [Novosphingobium sp. BL-52-GroH]|uniref:Rieske 2Fe-2S domain-containing protein n=1 Tax=Novosphingobium sp. BL-52-GroH TaxID=3349877 RepID=UPI0038511F93